MQRRRGGSDAERAVWEDAAGALRHQVSACVGVCMRADVRVWVRVHKADEVVLMESAQYGRMQLGRCVIR